MDEVPPVVFQPVDGDGEYAVVVDHVFDATTLRDVLRAAAEGARKKAERVNSVTIRERHEKRHEIFSRYADRFERVRVLEAERIRNALGVRREASQR